MTKRDDNAAQFYSDPKNRQPVGRGRKQDASPGRLANHVPIRFSTETISRVKVLAELDGLTVSSWVRGVVEREIERRFPSKHETRLSVRVRAWQFYAPAQQPEDQTGLAEWDSERVILKLS
jgi:hypothetical protein